MCPTCFYGALLKLAGATRAMASIDLPVFLERVKGMVDLPGGPPPGVLSMADMATIGEAAQAFLRELDAKGVVL